MYYHCRDIKYVSYGKVYPPSEQTLLENESFLINAYKWLGNYCGYCPQIWLSRSNIRMTGFKTIKRYSKQNGTYKKEGFGDICKVKTVIEKVDDILFGFDNIQGFPVKFDIWEMILSELSNEKDFDKQNKSIGEMMSDLTNDMIESIGTDHEYTDPILLNWQKCNGVCDFYKKYLFIEHDQVVTPSINLKSAKQIICRNEKQKKTLRKMGFIEDRIKIKNMTRQL